MCPARFMCPWSTIQSIKNSVGTWMRLTEWIPRCQGPCSGERAKAFTSSVQRKSTWSSWTTISWFGSAAATRLSMSSWGSTERRSWIRCRGKSTEPPCKRLRITRTWLTISPEEATASISMQASPCRTSLREWHQEVREHQLRPCLVSRPIRDRAPETAMANNNHKNEAYSPHPKRTH